MVNAELNAGDRKYNIKYRADMNMFSHSEDSILYNGPKETTVIINDKELTVKNGDLINLHNLQVIRGLI